MKNAHSILVPQFLSCYNFKWGWSNLVSPQETELNDTGDLLQYYNYVKNATGVLFYLFYLSNLFYFVLLDAFIVQLKLLPPSRKGKERRKRKKHCLVWTKLEGNEPQEAEDSGFDLPKPINYSLS